MNNEEITLAEWGRYLAELDALEEKYLADRDAIRNKFCAEQKANRVKEVGNDR